MKKFTSNPEKIGFQPKRNMLLHNWKLMMAVLAAFSFIFIHPAFSQTTTCSGTTTITTVNAASCTPGTAFNISGTGTGPTMSTCNTGGIAANNWGQFVANGTSATISYAPAAGKDAIIYAYSGTCISLTEIGCVNNWGNGVQEDLALTGLTPGATYYVRIVRNASTNSMNGNICIASPYSITTGAISSSPFCAGSNVSVSFTSIGIFSGNTYTAQLSNSSGIFASPVSIGTLVSNANTGTISATIPSGTAAGTGYRIRVISSSPSVTGSDNGTNLTINPLPQGSLMGNTICGGVGTPQLILTATSGTGPFTLVYDNGVTYPTQSGVTSGTGFGASPVPSSTTSYALLSITDNNGCVRSSGFTSALATITFSNLPSITTSAATAATCFSSSAQNSSLSYSSTLYSPTNYSITWNAAALAAGLVNVSSIALPANPIAVPIAANVAAGTYTGTLNVTNAAGCSNAGNSFTVTINPLPTITASATAAARCFSASIQTSTLSYSATTNSPTNYTITWNAAALTAGLVNVSSTALPATPITFSIAGGVAAGTYTGTLAVTNANGCASTGSSFTVTVLGLPTITSSASAAARCTSSSAQTTTLSYSATTNTPTLYTITWNAAALAAGLVNVGSTAIPATPITFSIAASVAAGTYTGTLAVTNANGCSSTGNTFTVTVSSYPVMTSASTASVCTGGTVSILLTSDISSNYTWIAASNVNVTGQSTTTQSTSTLSNTLTLSTASATSVIYTVTPTSTIGSCTGSPQTVTVLVNPLPTITASATAASRCFSSGSQTSTLSYSATTHSPTNYTITWNAAALTAGLVNVSSTALPATPITFPIAASVAAGTYTGTLAVTNVNGCISTGSSFTVTVLGLPTITSSASAAARCTSSSAQTTTLSYSATTNTPTLYTITWNAAALAAGLVNMGSTAIPVTPITFSIAASVAAGTYTGTLTVTNANGCSSTGNTFTVTVSSYPVMTSASTASVCTGGTVSILLTSDISSNYTWIAASNANVTGESTTTQSTSTLSNTLTLSTASATSVIYTVTPTSTIGSCTGSPQTVTVLVNPLPTITVSATATAKCFSSSGQTSTLSYSSTTGSPTQYSITWNAAALAAGLVNVGSAALPATPITFSIAGGVAAGTYTGTLAVTNTNGCTSAGNSFTLSIVAAPAITTQPTDKAACDGTSINFSITATGTSLSYQWRKGTANLTNVGNISGATSATLTINPVGTPDDATDYNCVITSGSCSGLISNYVSLTVNGSASTPSLQPTALVFPSVNVTSIVGSFSPSITAAYYLVIRKTTNVAPSAPVDGSTYTMGSSALTGYIEYVGTGTNFTSNGLTSGTTYYYWIYGYNTGSCGTSPVYLPSSPLTGNAITGTNISCGTLTTLYWGGAGSSIPGFTSGTDFNTAANWSTSSSTYVASPTAPTQCNNVSMALNNSATITLSADIDIYGLNYTITGNGKIAKLSTQGFTLKVNDNAVIDVLNGDNSTQIFIGENSAGSGIVDFRANFKLGETYFASTYPQSLLVGNVNSKIIFRGDVLFGRTAKFILPGGSGYPPSYPLAIPGTGTTPGTIEFDGFGLQQVLWNNNVYYDCFYNIVVGNENKPYVKHVTGTYTPDNILNNFTINDGCTVDMAASQWIREKQGGTFTMNGSAKLILGNNKAVRSSASTGVAIPGSNFPGGFTTMDISSGSTIEYNGGNGMTQTVYGTPSVGTLTYGNLTLSNMDGTGTANKISSSVITVAGATTISDKTTMTLGANFVSNGDATVSNGGTLVCGTLTVSGTGSYNLASGGTLNMGSTAGITSSGATGNIQTTTRNFGTAGNYIYSGSSAQVVGDGLPATVNNLTINNSSGVTMYAAAINFTVAGTLKLTSGALTINGDTLTINTLQRTSGTLTGSNTSSVGISGTSVPLFFTSGSRILKNLFLNTNATANLQTALDITAGSSSGSVAVASGATLTTFDNLTLKSDANGTARVAQIPVDGSGNALGSISGKVQIERYIPAKRGWRMMTVPVQSTAAPTINTAWQEGVVNTDLVYANNINPNPGFGIHISGSSSSLGFDPTPFNNPSLMIFNRASSSWSGIPNTLSTTVKDYEGYMLFVRGSRSTNLNYNQYAATSNAVIRALGNLRTGKQTINLTGGTGSYSVVGNPFASSIDFRNVSTSGSVSGTTFVMWDPALTGIRGVGAYQYFTQTGGPGTDFTVFPGGGSYGAALSINNTIQSGQAFLIQNSGTGSVIINENAKVGTSNSMVFRPMPNNTLGRISVLLSSVDTDSTTTLLDGALTLYGNNFSDAFDLDDAKKMINNSENFGISAGGALYQIEKKATINETDTIQYNMRSMKIKNYRFAIQLANLNAVVARAYLKDKFTNSETALNVDGATIYSFNVTSDAASLSQDRFKIYFRLMNVLPVTFTNINAYRQNATIKTEWKVANEINVKRYEVEKSTDGIHFTRKQIETNVNNNNNSNNYEWTDEQPQFGLNYFRVKSIDINGREKYTPIAKVFFGEQASSIAVFPNPVTDGKINLYFTAQPGGEYTATLYSFIGQLLKTTKIQQAEGNGNAVIDLDNNTAHGNYILEIIKPDNSKTSIKIVY